jgi:DNA-directed RNA polymerase specialized sigma24 family protein
LSAYSDTLKPIRRQTPEKCIESKPAFPSRKGGGPITPRTAERALEVASRACLPPDQCFSFQSIRALGRALQRGRGERRLSEKLASKVREAIKPYFMRRLEEGYFVDYADAEDALQETLVRWLELRRSRYKNCTGFKENVALCLTIAGLVRRELKRKHDCATNLEDFFWEALTMSESDGEISAEHLDFETVRLHITELLHGDDINTYIIMESYSRDDKS